MSACINKNGNPDEIGVIEIKYYGITRVLVFSLKFNILDDTDRFRRFVLICNNLDQIKSVYPCASAETFESIDLDRIRKYIADSNSTITLSDVSRLHNDLMSLLEVRYVVPLNVSHDWGGCAHELHSPLNELTRKICADGISQGLTTKEILRKYTKAQKEIEFVPSDEFIKCTKLTLDFIESALYLDKPQYEVMPYCLIPVHYYF